jgi:hypothetical protein
VQLVKQRIVEANARRLVQEKNAVKHGLPKRRMWSATHAGFCLEKFGKILEKIKTAGRELRTLVGDAGKGKRQMEDLQAGGGFMNHGH